MAQHISERLRNPAGRDVFESLAKVRPQDKATMLRRFAKEAGLEDWESCVWAAEFENSVEDDFGPGPLDAEINGNQLTLRGMYRTDTFSVHDLQKLQEAMRNIGEEDPERTITIKAGAEVPYKDVVRVMDAARGGGVSQVVMGVAGKRGR